MGEVIVCERLHKRYGQIVALNHITLSIEAGVTGLLGPNGAGKSTLISVLLGQTPASGGRAFVLRLDARRQQRLIRRRVGFVPENNCVIPGLTGTGYVCYAGRLAGMSYSDAMQRAHEALDYVGLDEARYRPVEEYSTGMKQRLKLAQAIVHDPDLLLLDEPTNGMDPQGRQAMLALITDLGRAGISALLSSHLLPDVERVCERVVIMGSGEVLTTGRIADMNKPHPTLYHVDFTGDAAAFGRCLEEHGVRVLETADGRLHLELPGEGTQTAVIQASQEAEVRLHGFCPKRSSLEETFMAAISKQGVR